MQKSAKTAKKAIRQFAPFSRQTAVLYKMEITENPLSKFNFKKSKGTKMGH